MILLPLIETDDDYVRIYRDEQVWLPAMRAICQRHRLDPVSLEFAPPGTHVVFRASPNRIIKLFALPWRGDIVPERLVLERLAGHPVIPAPQLVAEGELEGWSYLILTAVEGTPVGQVWDALEDHDREQIATRTGELIAALHRIPVEGLEPITVDWAAFLGERLRASAEQHARAGATPVWVAAIREFLQDLPPLFEPDFRPVLLNADITDEHLLVSRRGQSWDVTGLIDYGDAMLGHPLYEFVATLSITRGARPLRRSLFLACGFREDQLDRLLERKLMAYTLLHRFADVRWLLALAGDVPPGDIRALERILWSFG